MFQNYVLVALRNLFKHKLYSLINIGGLAVGLAAVILIALFVRYETSFDKFWENGDKVYRAAVTFDVPGRGEMKMTRTPGVLQPTMAREFAGYIQASSRLFRDCFEIEAGPNKFSECADFVDPEFFKLFNFEVVAGNKDLALANNTSIMIAESVALKYFGQGDVIGKTMIMDDTAYTVVAVMKDLPANSHINSDMIGLFDESRYIEQPWVAQQWTSTNVYTYFMLKDGLTLDSVLQDLPDMLNTHVDFQIPGLEEVKATDLMKFKFTKVSDIHLYSTEDGNMVPPGNITQVYMFSGIAFLVLMIATINFMNLSTARASQRAREVSMRKVMGASRKQLMAQFLGEAVIMTLFGLGLAVVLVKALLPLYSSFLSTELTFSITTDYGLMLSMLGLVFFIGLLGGLYPAFVLSGFRPSKVLHANQSSNSGSNLFRNVLVVAQFSITIVLMIATGVIYGQTLYATSIDFGYQPEDRAVFRGVFGENLQQREASIRAELMNLPFIEGVALASDDLPLRNNNNTLIEAPGGQIAGNMLVEQLRFNEDMWDLYDIKPVAGRVFSRDFPTDIFIASPEPKEGEKAIVDHLNIVINEMTAFRLGYVDPADAINQTVNAMVGNGPESRAIATIIGVVPNIIYRSAREQVTPMMYTHQPDSYNAVHVKLKQGYGQAEIAELERVWKEVSGDETVTLRFVEESIDNLYRAERQQAMMFVFFSFFAIFVACLGLFGMANFTAERSKKENGLRKVMGASVFDIVSLLVLRASKPVLWANVLAWPIAFYFINEWLQGFTVRMDIVYIGAVFLGAGLLATLIAWATISVQAVRSARSNPINAIRCE